MDEQELRRCYHCNRIWMKLEVAGEGCCPACGSRKFREVHRMLDKEMEELTARGFDATGWEHHDSPLG